MSTKIYKNTTDKDMDVVGIGPIPAGEQISLSSENLQPVMIANYPGLIDMTDFTTREIEAEATPEPTGSIKVEIKKPEDGIIE